MARMQERIDDYLAFGVQLLCGLIHPITRRAFIYTSGEMHEAKDGVLTPKIPRFASLSRSCEAGP